MNNFTPPANGAILGTYLKGNIDKDYVADPLKNLEEDLKIGKKFDSKFELTTVSKKVLLRLIKNLKKKQSAGIDGLSLILNQKWYIPKNKSHFKKV